MLENTVGKADYKKAEEALKKHFVVKSNATFQRHVCRQITQRDGEGSGQLVTRLRKAAEGSNSGADFENQVRDQVVQGCKSNNLRRMLLEKGPTLTMKEILTVAASFEAVEAQFQAMKLDGVSSSGSGESSSGNIHMTSSSRGREQARGKT